MRGDTLIISDVCGCIKFNNIIELIVQKMETARFDY